MIAEDQIPKYFPIDIETQITQIYIFRIIQQRNDIKQSFIYVRVTKMSTHKSSMPTQNSPKPNILGQIVRR